MISTLLSSEYKIWRTCGQKKELESNIWAIDSNETLVKWVHSARAVCTYTFLEEITRVSEMIGPPVQFEIAAYFTNSWQSHVLVCEDGRTSQTRVLFCTLLFTGATGQLETSQMVSTIFCVIEVFWGCVCWLSVIFMFINNSEGQGLGKKAFIKWWHYLWLVKNCTWV